MIDYSYLRPKKGTALKRIHNGSFRKKTSLACPYYDDAVVLPLRSDEKLLFGKGGVVADGEYIELSGIPGRVGGFYEFCDPARSDMSVVYCGYLPDHWGHFLIEGVARLWFALKTVENIDRYVFISEENTTKQLSGNYLEFFDLLGITAKVEFISSPVVFKRVYVPELGYSREQWYSEEYIRLFEAVADSALKKSTLTDTAEKVYLSRAMFKGAAKKEMGYEMLDSFFLNNGYRIVYPETVSLTDMVHYLHNADMIAAESGTLPHNLLFAQQGKHCQIMERQTVPNEIQANIDIIKNLNVTYVDCNYMVYPGTAGGGPFIIAYNKWMRRFADDNGLSPPDERYLTEKHVSKCLSGYMRAYRKNYGRQWGLESWMLLYAEEFYEAYTDSFEDLSVYLTGNRPFLFKHFFKLRYWKRAIKNMIKLADGLAGKN